MVRSLGFAAGFAAGYAVRAGVGAGAGQPSAQLRTPVHRSSALPAVQQWAGRLSSAASTLTGSARSAFRQARARLSPEPDPHDAASGGVIPLGAVPIDQLSEWELDLLTTPDSSR